MAVTSGTYNTTTLMAQDVITAAMQDIRVLSATGTPTSNDFTACVLRLNTMLKRWETKGWLLWLADLIAVPCQPNKFRYTIGPNGDVDPGYRPLRIREGSYIRTTCGTTTPFDTTLQVLSRLEYLQYSSKSTLGIPNSIYYDPQQGPGPNPASYDPYAAGWGVLYVFTAPMDSTRTVYMDAHRPIQDITAMGQTFDLPMEWYDAMIKCLGARIVDMYEVPEDRTNRVKAEGREAEEYIANWGVQEWAPTWFQPDYQYLRR
jgi:hypothetical protein